MRSSTTSRSCEQGNPAISSRLGSSTLSATQFPIACTPLSVLAALDHFTCTHHTTSKQLPLGTHDWGYHATNSFQNFEAGSLREAYLLLMSKVASSNGTSRVQCLLQFFFNRLGAGVSARPKLYSEARRRVTFDKGKEESYF